MKKQLTEAQKHGERMRAKGRDYHGGYVREEYQKEQTMLREGYDSSAEGPKERYHKRVKEMLAFIDKINKPFYKKKED